MLSLSIFLPHHTTQSLRKVLRLVMKSIFLAKLNSNCLFSPKYYIFVINNAICLPIKPHRVMIQLFHKESTEVQRSNNLAEKEHFVKHLDNVNLV